MPNVIERMNDENRRVEWLFAQFEATHDLDTAVQLCDELAVHVTDNDGDATDLIARIRRMTPGDADLAPTVGSLKEAIAASPAPAPALGLSLSPAFPPTEVRGTATTTEFASMTKDELYKLAKERDIDGRSKMKKDELIRALSRT